MRGAIQRAAAESEEHVPRKSVVHIRSVSIVEALERVQHEIIDSPGSLLLGQEVERRRIARELHDDICQRLALLSMSMSDIAHAAAGALPGLSDQIRNARSEVERITSDVRCISHNLHPAVVPHVGVIGAIRQLCAEFSRRMGIEVELIADDSLDLTSGDAALGLYRVTQEALTNVARHSRSTSATVSLVQDAGAIQLTITDAGVGFDTSQLQSTDGIGLTSIREWASMLDAMLEVRSAPTIGTTIDLRVPLRDASASVPGADQRRPRVLLGDDHTGVLRALVRLLTPSCDVVGCATDAAAVLEAVAARQPDVVVLDLNLRSMNGLELCRRIRKTAHARTVILTAFGYTPTRDAAFAAGAAAFVVKSRMADDLLPAILTPFGTHSQPFAPST